MELTQDQKDALAAFKDFLVSDDRIFIMKGSAGSGKTSLLKLFVDIAKGNWHCSLMVPTGRASYILGEKTKHEASTIHRAIYKIEDGPQKEESGCMKFRLRPNNDALQSIYFVDEASMISDVFSHNDRFQFGSGFLLKDLLEYCGGRKVVFVGDYAQLPPVGQVFSPALSMEYLYEKYHVKCSETVLRQVVRQVESSAVFQNALSIRDAVEKKCYNEFRINDGTDVEKCESLIDKYTQVTNNCVDIDAIVISYTNKQALDYNLAIRASIFPDGRQRLEPGDLLIISQNNYSQFAELFNGTIVKVLDCDKDAMVMSRTVHFKTADKDANDNSITKEIKLSFRHVTIETPKGEIVNCVIFDDFLTDSAGQPSKYLNQALATDFNQRMSELKIKYGSNEYDARRKTDKYLNCVVCKYGYAITCHKAQGGEWEKVFVDMDKMGGKMCEDYFRWAYTAITRSCGNLWHFAAPEFDAVCDMKIKPIQKCNSINYYAPAGIDFLDWRFRKISDLCRENDIECQEDRSKNYQHILRFLRQDGENCTVQLWYSKSGYSKAPNVTSAPDPSFSALILDILRLSVIPDEVPFVPHSDFALKLHEYVLGLAKEMDLPLLNIRQELWKDIYYFGTAPFESAVGFFYDGKGKYTNIEPQSTGGNEDTLLKEFCEKL